QDTATTDIYTLSLHDALPILDFAEFSSAVDFLNTSTIQGNPDLVPEKAWKSRIEWEHRFGGRAAMTLAAFYDKVEDVHDLVVERSEEHTSELQSRENLVCRLL